MDLRYAADGQTLAARAGRGDASIQLAGRPAAGPSDQGHARSMSRWRRTARRRRADRRASVVLTLPAEGGRAGADDPVGDHGRQRGAGRGLTQAQFTGDVEFRERGAGQRATERHRVARAATLESR